MCNRMNSACKNWFLFVVFFFITQTGFALPFNITTKTATVLPTTVPVGGVAPAYYTVQNNTGTTRINNFVKYFPPNVSQIVVGGTYPNTCGSTFTLAPRGSAGDSCTLQLAVTGAVDANDPDPHHHLFVCFPGGLTCAGTVNPLNVIAGPAVLVSITVLPANKTIPPGTTQQYQAIANYSDGTTQDVTASSAWISTDPTVATITPGPNGGLATAGFLGGTTEIQATFGGKTGSTCLTVPTLISIEVTPPNASILVNKTLQFTATGHYSDGSTAPLTNLVTWNSLGTSATIDMNGLATCLGEGSATITATLGSVTGSTTLTNTIAILTAVGQQSPSNLPPGPPLLAQSLDSGNNWNVFPNGSFDPFMTITNGKFSQTACTGSGTSALCTAVGEDDSASPTKVPILIQTLNGGSTWGKFTEFCPDIPVKGVFFGTACTGSGNAAVCTAVGQDQTLVTPQPPLLAQTRNGGVNWGEFFISSLAATSGIFNGTACTGAGGSAICTAVGLLNPSSPIPLLAQTTDGGASWNEFTSFSPSIPPLGFFNSTSCTGSGNTAICTAVGQDQTLVTPQPPLLAQTRDGGLSWGEVFISSLAATSGIFKGTACTGTVSSARCTAAGLLNPISPIPLLAQSTDGGISWNQVTSFSPVIPSQGFFNSTACTGSGNTTICIAVGKDTSVTPNLPLLVQTKDGGANWGRFSFNPAIKGTFNAAACTGSGVNTAICIAAGQLNSGALLLAETTDHGNSWTIKSIGGAPPLGVFNGAGATGGSSNELPRKSFGAEKALKETFKM